MTDAQPTDFKGHCLCGEIQFRVAGKFIQRIHCYCDMCRRSHGADYSAWLTCLTADFQFTKGDDQVKVYQSSPGVERSFCSQCGSRLFWHDDSEYNKTHTSFTEGLLVGSAGELPLLEFHKEG